MILSGMSSMEQVVENVAIAERAGNSKLNKQEIAFMEKVREAYKDLRPVPCTACRYCMPCENGVEIPVIFRIYNEMKMYGATPMTRGLYGGGGRGWGVTKDQTADNCKECGKCAEKCPQHIEISDWLKKVHEELMSLPVPERRW